VKGGLADKLLNIYFLITQVLMAHLLSGSETELSKQQLSLCGMKGREGTRGQQ